MFELIFFIIIIVFISNIKKKKEQLSNQEKPDDSHQVKNYEGTIRTIPNNSYYSKEKIIQYKKQEMNHQNHEDITDISNDIGYKRCPNCQNQISKKSKTCFMCNYDFENNKAKEKNVENK